MYAGQLLTISRFSDSETSFAKHAAGSCSAPSVPNIGSTAMLAAPNRVPPAPRSSPRRLRAGARQRPLVMAYPDSCAAAEDIVRVRS